MMSTFDFYMLSQLKAVVISLKCFSTKVCVEDWSRGSEFSFRPTWSYLFFQVLATWVKFLAPSSYYIVINFAFAFCTTNIFGCFIMAQFELRKHKFPNISYSFVWLSNPTYRAAMYIVSVHQLPQYYPPQWVPFMAWTASITLYTGWKTKWGYIFFLTDIALIKNFIWTNFAY